MSENIEQEFDLLAEYAKAKELAAKTELDGSEESISIYLDVTYGDVLMAERNMEWEVSREYENSALVREMLEYGRKLMQYKEAVPQLYSVAERIEDTLNNHPRLKLELYKFELELLPMLGPDADVDTESEVERLRTLADMYEKNIAYADKGEFDKIRDTTRMLAYDPMEWSERWEEITDEVEAKLSKEFEGEVRRMGFCFGYWSAKTALLRSEYGIEWRDPHMMNPGVMFD